MSTDLAQAHKDLHAAAETDFDFEKKSHLNKKAKTIPVWKGSHERCKHQLGTCLSVKGWQLTKEGGFRPIIIDVVVEKRVMALTEYDDDSGRGAEPNWKAKGGVPAAEAEGCKPDPRVLSELVDRGAESLEKALEHKKATYETTAKAIAEFRARYAAALGKAEESAHRKGAPRG